jgi:hypothetical protein
LVAWNAFGNRITQDMMMVAANAIVSKTRTVNGKSGMSLCDMGYCSVGVDEVSGYGTHTCARFL